MADVIVKESPIEGKGVFAGRDFKKGETVIKWSIGNTLNEKEARELPEDEKKYLNIHEGTLFLMQPPGRYVNHSCEANTTAKDFCDVAKRDIKEGEEITADYSEEVPPGFEMECNCGSEKCRGTIRRRE